jgi:hypothetical protein
MRRTAAALITALLVAAAAGTIQVNLGKANPTIFTYAYLPIISVHSPANNTYVNVDEVLLNFTITRPKGWNMTMTATDWKIAQELQTVEIRVDYEPYTSIIVNNNLSSAPFNYHVYLSNLKDGEHNVTVTALASAFEYAQWYYRPISYTISNRSIVNFTIDTSSPAVHVLSLENKTYFSPDLQLNFTINEFVSRVWYVLDGQNNLTVSGNSTLSGLSVGLHNVTVYAWDTAGNVGVSETSTFTVAQPEPESELFPVVLVAVAVIAVAAAAGLLVARRKRHKEKAQK